MDDFIDVSLYSVLELCMSKRITFATPLKAVRVPVEMDLFYG